MISRIRLTFLEVLILFISIICFILLNYPIIVNFLILLFFFTVLIFIQDKGFKVYLIKFKVLFYLLLFIILINFLINIKFLLFFLFMLFWFLLLVVLLLFSTGLHYRTKTPLLFIFIYLLAITQGVLLLLFPLLKYVVDFLCFWLIEYNSIAEVFVILYFLKYQFIWLSKVFWFRIAIGGMVIMYIGLFIMFLGEHDPYFIKRGRQIVYWFFTEGDLDLIHGGNYFLSNFYLIRHSFTVTTHYSYDIKPLLKYSLFVVVILFINFLLLSFVSVWLYEVFWFYFYYKFSSNFVWFIFIYIFLFLMFLNLFLAFFSLFFMVYISAFAIEAKFSYDFTSPYGDMITAIQDDEFDGHLYAPSTISGSYTYRYFSLLKIHLLMLPQRLGIKPLTSILIHCPCSKWNTKIHMDYLFLLKDIYCFLNNLKLNYLFLRITKVLDFIDLSFNNNIIVKIEFLLIIKISLININIYDTLAIKKLVVKICSLEERYLKSFSLGSVYYSSYFLNKDFILNNIFKNNLINRFNFLYYIIADSPLVISKGLSFTYQGFTINLPKYHIGSRDLLKFKLNTLNNLYGFYNFIIRDITSSLNLSKVYISTGLGLKVKVDFCLLLNVKEYRFLKGLLINYKRIEYWDNFDFNEKILFKFKVYIYKC